MSLKQLKEYFIECDNYREEEKVIIFMRVGGFYEAYYCPLGRGSGKRVSEVLHIHLTCKTIRGLQKKILNSQDFSRADLKSI